MRQEYYEEFVRLNEAGRKQEVKPILKKFIQSFSSIEEKEKWATEFLEHEKYGHKIRHEIYEEIIFPVLLKGYKEKLAWAYKWLGKTIQNVYAKRELSEKIDNKSSHQLLKEAFKITPNDTDLRKSLLSSVINNLDFAFHEWPTGIIFDAKKDAIEECDEVWKEIQFARSIDNESQFLARYEEWERYTLLERERQIKKRNRHR